MLNDAAANSIDERYQRACDRAERAGQGHLLAHWPTLSLEEQQQLLLELEELDYDYLSRVFQASIAASTPAVEASSASRSTVEPATDVLQLKDITPEQRQRWREHGLRLIAEGRAAVLLLAGGQGTRLGSSAPKGCYDIGLPSHKSLFQLQAERLLKVQRLAAEAAAAPGAPDPSPPPRPLHWYIMTSPFTHTETVEHFEAHGYFGLSRDQVHLFQQGFLPCFTEDGKLILESRCSLAKAPDGNGGLYTSLARSGALEALEAAGVEAVDVYCVDNCLARLGDPLFLGYCHGEARADVGARVVAKAYPEEKVGVFAIRRQSDPSCPTGTIATTNTNTSSSSLAVLEYSELDPALASATNPATGQLYYNWSNICMHYFAVPWLRTVANRLIHGGADGAAAADAATASASCAAVPYHVARKKIPSVDGPVAGVKLELFIFDTFDMAGERTALVEVARREEFAPVKNAPGSATDSPDTARAAVLALHGSWVEAAGGRLAGEAAAAGGVEVSPLVSYAGEGLEGLARGRVYDRLYVEELQRVG